jgi:hypothetical protein
MITIVIIITIVNFYFRIINSRYWYYTHLIIPYDIFKTLFKVSKNSSFFIVLRNSLHDKITNNKYKPKTMKKEEFLETLNKVLNIS